MSNPCRVCENPSTQQLGSYHFCDQHYQYAQRHRGSIWQADIASVLLLSLFVLLIFGLERWLQPQFSATSLLLTGIILALIPAATWLLFFYRRDRLEPEPEGKVIQMFLLGGLMAMGVGIPLVENVYDVPNWLNSSPLLVRFLGGFLIVGFAQEFLKYVAVRFTIYESQEFNEFSDGVIYTTAVGIGYATILNIAFVINSGGLDLGVGVLRIVITTLAHASFAGVTGYFLGIQKFEDKPLWWMPAGVTLAALLNSLFFFIRGILIQGQFGLANQWVGLLLVTILAGSITWFLSRAMQAELRTLLALQEVADA